MERIQINGYKSIRQLDLKLEPINIFIGANGSGKSNFLSFFEFLKNIYNQNLREFVALRGGVYKFLHKGDKFTDEISAKLFFSNQGMYTFTIKPGGGPFIFTKEFLWNEQNQNFENEINIASLSYESNLRFSILPGASYVSDYLKKLVKYHFQDTGENSSFNKDSNIENDGYILYEKGQNIAAFLFNLYHENRTSYNFIIKIIESIAPFFLDFALHANPAGFVKFLWQTKYTSLIYGPSDLSDGTIRFIALTVLFMQPNLPETIIINEPELGLHPAAIAKLAGMIQSAAAKGCQVIIATQSTDLISHFSPENIVTVDQKNGESIFERLNGETLEKWLQDYTIDDLWKRNIIATGQQTLN